MPEGGVRKFPVDDLIKEVREQTHGKQYMTGENVPFFGKLIVCFQNGERTHLEIRQTVK